MVTRIYLDPHAGTALQTCRTGVGVLLIVILVGLEIYESEQGWSVLYLEGNGALLGDRKPMIGSAH
jgi:hypothetical protein